ncbi:hypothetical protein COT95_02255 [Candidatus Falkowbacteria bacterium CG10_big_fil_rev_8_21_14_0_10_37_6]|uniref:Prepilin-type N-terminal cleavage/methylation domain-containing protein n=1 Tax=Candidatus Falkowbacteria bacterium CG10_big_fil_rev_8_21_14_0_10_37_6 TaxID=1974563 RepID=A0A2H0V8Z0_9BACT|nr:MAG: hypothetical protein COT95_02255 [Candidatus Falkowbacteria bacterium CG10_big_fil_rev_8_21_14_0_10_37_6]
MFNTRKKQSGFALLEVMASVAIISFSMLGVFSLVIYNQKIYLDNKYKFVGTTLSQEGIELVRNVRDSNWIDGSAFNDGLDLPIFTIDTNSNIKGSINAVTGIDDNGAKVKLLGAFYNHALGDDTIFSRIIQIDNIDEVGGNAIDGLKVTSFVQWKYRNITRQHQTVVFLYDWR